MSVTGDDVGLPVTEITISHSFFAVKKMEGDAFSSLAPTLSAVQLVC